MPGEYCKHGCYPVDRRWHGGDLVGEVDGEEFPINDIFDLRRFIRAKDREDRAFGPGAAEALLNEQTPAGEPYVRGRKADPRDDIDTKIRRRHISISGIGQGFDMGAVLTMTDRLDTFYNYDTAKVMDWIRASPQSQVHQELSQRRQQAEQQINRTLGNLEDLYERKQLLEHDLRKLRARKEHFDKAEEDSEDTQDELKADFVDLVDQHTGRHSILQMQANNIFPSITADFYAMRGLEDLEDGKLANLPQNEKAVLRKKWKLFEKWKDQFRTAVDSKLNDVKRRLNSVNASIERTEEWLKPYVQDIVQIDGDFWGSVGEFGEIDVSAGLGHLMPEGYANTYRFMKTLGSKEMSPSGIEGKYYDVVVINSFHLGGAGLENPQAAGQGLVILSTYFREFLVCEHVHEEIFDPQKARVHNLVEEYLSGYVGEIDFTDTRGKLRGELRGMVKGTNLEKEFRERIEDADSERDLRAIEEEIWEEMKPGKLGRWSNRMKERFGITGENYYPEPSELRRELVGPGFPARFYLDVKYDNNLYVMK